MACVYDKNGSEEYKTFLDKYFEKNYKIVTQDEGDDCNESEDYCILKHSNKVCVLMLASGHSLLKEQKDIIEVDFQITPTTNRMDNKVIGKSKRGAQWLTNVSPICLVRCSDGTQYTLKSCVPGKLLEVNQKLSKEPMLLARKGGHLGFWPPSWKWVAQATYHDHHLFQ
ncbi:protein Abitram-like isoform X2 [Apostichopus japonicus]|uniref:protein Abitram-like isoform X2 n=1 Tax=Stichopus japonicus TaxID=307972 RepID=UPI003AB8F16E